MEWDLGLCDSKLGAQDLSCVEGDGYTASEKSGLSHEASELPGDFKEGYDTQNWVLERLFTLASLWRMH